MSHSPVRVLSPSYNELCPNIVSEEVNKPCHVGLKFKFCRPSLQWSPESLRSSRNSAPMSLNPEDLLEDFLENKIS
jgi:hypothetical protein